MEVARDVATRANFIPAANNTNSLTTYFAFVVIHDFFRTDSGRGRVGDVDRHWLNLHSSYLDMQPLYGFTKERADSVRTFKDGKLKVDEIADDRLKRIRVAKCIVILFNREHNFICDELIRRYPGRFTTDEELYQQARLINCAVWVNCIKREYTCGVAGIIPKGGEPGALLKNAASHRHKDAHGFHCTLEFNLMYRFHATVPAIFDPNQMRYFDHDMELDLHKAVTNPSGSFGPFNVPKFLVPVEAAAIDMCRKYKLITFNQFRESVGLKKYKSYSEFNSDPKLVAALEKHFAHVDHVDLSTGLLAESAANDGWGLSKTLAFAILADAVACLSHDRFYTLDYTSDVYTDWGFAHANSAVTADLLNRHTKITVPRDVCLTQVQPANFLELLNQRPDFAVQPVKSNKPNRKLQIPIHYKRKMKSFHEGIDPEFQEIAQSCYYTIGIQRAKQDVHATAGVAAMGKLVIDANPEFPAHSLFAAGTTLPVVIRHRSWNKFADDAIMDIREADFRILRIESDLHQNSMHDMHFSTGAILPTSTAANHIHLMKALAKGLPNSAAKAWFSQRPWAIWSMLEGIRDPTSFASLYYNSKFTTWFQDQSGKLWFARFRLRPSDATEDSGFVDEMLYRNNYVGWDHVPRQPGDERPRDYLRAEFRNRMATGPVSYILEVVLRESSGDPALLDSSQAWDEHLYPFKRVGVITLDKLLPEEETRLLHFNAALAHPHIAVIPAKTAREPASMNHLRCLLDQAASEDALNGHKSTLDIITDILASKVLNAIRGNTAPESVPEGSEVYIVAVTTGHGKGAGTNGTVSLRLQGEFGHTESLKLDLRFYNDFEEGSTGEYTVVANDVGAVDSISLRVDHSSFFEDGKWLCSTVVVTERSTGRAFSIYPNAWITDGEWATFKVATSNAAV
eukprot:c6717_g1_i2.p1 GENE.c6717_g1_i2~~c6717_g1_i2.p1  ORF type:complete len:1039 (+),score=226.47 c6717_g1_i2:388-3117(+)